VYDPKRFSKNGYVKPQSVKTEKTYVLPRPDHILTLEERQAMKAKLMKPELLAKINSVYIVKTPEITIPDHISQTEKMVEPVGVNPSPTEHKPTQAENKAKLGQYIVDIMKLRQSKGGKAYTPPIETEPVKGHISELFKK
jgi:hypothetical protein